MRRASEPLPRLIARLESEQHVLEPLLPYHRYELPEVLRLELLLPIFTIHPVSYVVSDISDTSRCKVSILAVYLSVYHTRSHGIIRLSEVDEHFVTVENLG